MIDTAGNVIIKPTFTYISTHQSLPNLLEAGNEIDHKFRRGYIDLKGNIIIPLIYDNVFYLGNGFIRVGKNNKTGVLDTINKVILPITFTDAYYDNNLLIAKQNEFYRLYNVQGTLASPLKFIGVSWFKKNRAIVTFPDKSNAIIDNKGAIVLRCPKGYKLENILDDGTYLISQYVNSKKGVLDTFGNFQIECQYRDLLKCGDFFVANKEGMQGIISLKDSVCKQFIFDYINFCLFENYIDESNPYRVSNFYAIKDKLVGIVNPRMPDVIVPIKYRFISPLSDRYFIVKNESNKNGLYSIVGDVIIKEEYEFFNHFENKIFASKNNKTYIITLDANTYKEAEVQPQNFFQHINGDLYSNCQYQIFISNGKFGVINIENNIIIPSEYDKIQNVYHSNEFVVKQENKYGLVNSNNEIVVAIEHDAFSIGKEVISFTKSKSSKPMIHTIVYH